jgi:hypothetical protein
MSKNPSVLFTIISWILGENSFERFDRKQREHTKKKGYRIVDVSHDNGETFKKVKIKWIN